MSCAAAALRAVLAGLEPGTFSPEAAAMIAEELAATENACGAAKVRMAGRAAEGGAHRKRGYRGCVGLAGERDRVGGARRTPATRGGRLRWKRVPTRVTR